MGKKPEVLVKVPFASFLAYSSKGQSEESIASREMRDLVKHDRGRYIDIALKQVKTKEFRGFLGRRVWLVPAPGHLVGKGSATNLRICNVLVAERLGFRVVDCLKRTEEVAKSAFAKGLSDRTRVERHLDTMRCLRKSLEGAKSITVVDDFVTTGTSLSAFVSAVKHAAPDARVRAFALVRTVSFGDDVSSLVMPVIGRICSNGAGYSWLDLDNEELPF